VGRELGVRNREKGRRGAEEGPGICFQILIYTKVNYTNQQFHVQLVVCTVIARIVDVDISISVYVCNAIIGI